MHTRRFNALLVTHKDVIDKWRSTIDTEHVPTVSRLLGALIIPTTVDSTERRISFFKDAHQIIRNTGAPLLIRRRVTHVSNFVKQTELDENIEKFIREVVTKTLRINRGEPITSSDGKPMSEIQLLEGIEFGLRLRSELNRFMVINPVVVLLFTGQGDPFGVEERVSAFDALLSCKVFLEKRMVRLVPPKTAQLDERDAVDLHPFDCGCFSCLDREFKTTRQGRLL